MDQVIIIGSTKSTLVSEVYWDLQPPECEGFRFCNQLSNFRPETVPYHVCSNHRAGQFQQPETLSQVYRDV